MSKRGGARGLLAAAVLQLIPLDGCRGPATAGADLGAVPGAIYTFTTEPIHLEPGKQVDSEMRGNLGNPGPIQVTRFSVETQGSLHHFRLDAPPDPRWPLYTVISPPVGVSKWDLALPAGHAFPLIAEQPLLISYHFLNATQNPQAYTITIAVDTLPEDAPEPIPTSYYSFINTAIALPPGEATNLEGTCLLAHDLDLLTMLPHTHRLGRGVEARVLGGEHDGEVIYSTTKWEGAPVKHFDPPLHIPAGASVHWVCKYFNDTNAVVRFGPRAEEEMCGVAGYWAGSSVPFSGFIDGTMPACVADLRNFP